MTNKMRLLQSYREYAHNQKNRIHDACCKAVRAIHMMPDILQKKKKQEKEKKKPVKCSVHSQAT